MQVSGHPCGPNQERNTQKDKSNPSSERKNDARNQGCRQAVIGGETVVRNMRDEGSHPVHHERARIGPSVRGSEQQPRTNHRGEDERHDHGEPLTCVKPPADDPGHGDNDEEGVLSDQDGGKAHRVILTARLGRDLCPP